MVSEPSYVIGNSRAVLDLTDEQRARLDSARWVFMCNDAVRFWRHGGFRPTFWLFGDNHNEHVAAEMRANLMHIPTDPELCERLRHVWVCEEEYAGRVTEAIAASGVPARRYTRGMCWLPKERPARKLGQQIFHFGSTLTNLVNFANLLNPTEPIYIYGNEFRGDFGHFYEPAPRMLVHRDDRDRWDRVQVCMWQGLHDLCHDWGYNIVDCNRHGEPLPPGVHLPTGVL